MDKDGTGDIAKESLRDILAAHPDFDASLFANLAKSKPRPGSQLRFERRPSDPVFDAPFAATFNDDSDTMNRYTRAQVRGRERTVCR